jgi:uncharacterized phiE125 gp8 family phage protein
MIAPERIIPPAELISLEEAMLHLRVDGPEDYTLISGLIASAVSWLDGWNGVLGRCIMPQTWAIRTHALQSTRLPFPDVRSADVSYLDAAGETQIVDGANYALRTINGAGHLIFAPGYVAPQLAAGEDCPVTITAVFGFDEPPPPLKTAALMLVAHWYRHREGGTEDIPAPVKALIAPYRVGLV